MSLPPKPALTALKPLLSDQTRVLILGSFPGLASLRAQQYYAHPRNQFWKILHSIWPDAEMQPDNASYVAKSQWLLSKKLGLWDVYAACEREGSLDSRIRRPELNDFGALGQWCPHLMAVAHNGGESFKQAARIEVLGVRVYRLPSTSPAHASWTFEQKLLAWRAVFEEQGLIV